MKLIYAILLALLLTGCSVVGIRNYEEPNYKIVLQEDKFEVREYTDVLVAQSTSPGDYKQSSGNNFDRLAGYIFGKNQRQEKMDMTTPVLQEQQSEKMDMTVPVYQQQSDSSWTMTFVLPSKYTLETVPQPLDENVTVTVLEQVKVATLRFSGTMNEENILKHTQLLQTWLKNNQLKAVAKPYSAAYDPPWTLPILRRNEIHIPIQ